MPEDSDLRVKVLLSANRALLGTITPNLRGVTVDYSKEKFTLKAYFDNEATEQEKELIDQALAEIIADLHIDIEKFYFIPERIPFPNKMSVLSDWIYLRHEEHDREARA